MSDDPPTDGTGVRDWRLLPVLLCSGMFFVAFGWAAYLFFRRLNGAELVCSCVHCACCTDRPNQPLSSHISTGTSGGGGGTGTGTGGGSGGTTAAGSTGSGGNPHASSEAAAVGVESKFNYGSSAVPAAARSDMDLDAQMAYERATRSADAAYQSGGTGGDSTPRGSGRAGASTTTLGDLSSRPSPNRPLATWISAAEMFCFVIRSCWILAFAFADSAIVIEDGLFFTDTLCLITMFSGFSLIVNDWAQVWHSAHARNPRDVRCIAFCTNGVLWATQFFVIVLVALDRTILHNEVFRHANVLVIAVLFFILSLVFVYYGWQLRSFLTRMVMNDHTSSSFASSAAGAERREAQAVTSRTINRVVAVTWVCCFAFTVRMAAYFYYLVDDPPFAGLIQSYFTLFSFYVAVELIPGVSILFILRVPKRDAASDGVEDVALDRNEPRVSKTMAADYAAYDERYGATAAGTASAAADGRLNARRDSDGGATIENSILRAANTGFAGATNATGAAAAAIDPLMAAADDQRRQSAVLTATASRPSVYASHEQSADDYTDSTTSDDSSRPHPAGSVSVSRSGIGAAASGGGGGGRSSRARADSAGGDTGDINVDIADTGHDDADAFDTDPTTHAIRPTTISISRNAAPIHNSRASVSTKKSASARTYQSTNE